MIPEKQRALAAFSICLEKGDDAPLPPLLADELIKQVTLINYREKAPAHARKLNVTPRTFNRYQTGQSAPTLHKAVKLLDMLGYDVIIRKRQ